MFSLILGGITSLPYFGWAVSALPVLGLCSIIPLYFLVYKSNNINTSSTPCNVIITGGSSGIGLAIAKECFLNNARVKSITLIARNESKLERAKEQLLEMIKEQQQDSPEIQIISADVTDYKKIEQAVSGIKMEESTYLFVCAGVSHPGYFEEIPPHVFEEQMKLNYLGSVYTVKAILPLIKSGCMTLTSSAAGQVGVFGFTAYAPTKFALRGFAESLHMELSNSPVNIQLGFPPDTNTPGYQEEQLLKPKECHLISESAGLYESSDIAKKVVKEAMKSNPSFTISFGVEGWMLSAVTAGMSPVSGVLDAVTQVTLMSVFRFISLFYLNNFWSIVKQCESEKNKNAKASNNGGSSEDKKEQ